MPRTKRPVSKPKAPRLPEGEEAVRRKYLDEIVEEQKQALDQRCEAEIKNMEMAFRILTASLGKDMLNKTIGQLKSELVFKEAQVNGSRDASQDDEGSAQEEERCRRPRASRSATRHEQTVSRASRVTAPRRSRSSELRRPQTARKPPSAFKTPCARTPAIYKTPAYGNITNFPPITPKVVPNAPITILRRPRQGEMVVSLSGSPLMVPTMQAEDRANCNIPLYDGTMLSLQPEAMRKSNTMIPFSLLNGDTLQQVKTIKDNLDIVLQLKEKNIRT